MFLMCLPVLQKLCMISSFHKGFWENQSFNTKAEVKLVSVLINEFWEFKWSLRKVTRYLRTWKANQTPLDNFEAEF
jgi:hypothetical protein